MNGDAPRLCPHCATALREVGARARTGYLLALDQCDKCGGIWCDRWELFPIDPGDVARLDPIDDGRLRAPVPIPDAAGRCPRCAVALHRFRDPLLPAEAHIERCRVCEGMWLNRGELSRVKRRAASKERPRDADLERIAEAYGHKAAWSKVDDITPAMLPVDDGDDGSALRPFPWASTAWLVLRSLLQLLLRG